VQHCLLQHWEDMVTIQAKVALNGWTARILNSKARSIIFHDSLPSLDMSKGLHDKASSVLKRFIKKCQLDVWRTLAPKCKIGCVLLHEHLNHCLETSEGGEQRLISWTFWHIKTTNVDQTIKCTCSTIMGTRDVHSIQYADYMDVNKP
jgi:hypothetical protein